MNNISFNKIKGYFIISVLLFVSGSAFLANNIENDDTLLIGVLMLLVLINIKRLNVNIQLIKTILIISIISAFQFLLSEHNAILANIGFIIKIIIGYFAYQYLAGNFDYFFTKTIKIIAYYSLFLFLIFTIFPTLQEQAFDLLVNKNYLDSSGDGNFFIYSVNPYADYHRNSGPFWEPGVYQIFLNLALALNIIRRSHFNLKKDIFLILTIITTFSSMGYIVLMLILIYFSFKFSKRKVGYLLLAPLLFFVLLQVYESVPMLGAKIENQLSSTSIYDNDTQRFSSFTRDVLVIKSNFIFGTGQSLINRYGTIDKKAILNSTTGISDLFASYGLFFFLFYIYYMYKNSILLSSFIGKNEYKNITFLIIIISSFSEPILTLPFFLGIITLNNKKIQPSLHHENKYE